MKFLAALLVSVLLVSPALAAGGHTHQAMRSASVKKEKCHCTPATKAYKKAVKHMHHAMHVPYSGDYDTDFVRGMIPHHQGAIDMARVVLDHGYDPEIRTLATRIIAAQELEIASMKRWLVTRGKTTNTPCGTSEEAFEQAMQPMHRDMDIRYSGDADRDFARGMIPHHQGAVDMAWVLKSHGRDPELQRLSDDIIRSQNQEISQMKAWLEKKNNDHPSH